MLTSIIMGLLRHALTTAGGVMVANAVSLVEGLPVVHDMTTALMGGGLVTTGGILSVLHKIKTQSGPIYNFNK